MGVIANKTATGSSSLKDFEPEKVLKKSSYFSSVAGLLRICNVILGLISTTLASIGFADDVHNEDYSRAVYYITYYGLGYRKEPINYFYLVILSLCLACSTFFLIFLNCGENATEKYRAWNKFLNLSLAISLIVGWICGLLGFLLFRQGCCRVEIFSSETIKFENEGYQEPCLCMVKANSYPDLSYPVSTYQDVLNGPEIRSAMPHHFFGHVFSLAFTVLNIGFYFGAFFKL